MDVVSVYSEFPSAAAAEGAGVPVPPFQMIALDEAFEGLRFALAWLWEATLLPVAAPLFDLMSQNGELAALVGSLLCWLWAISATLRGAGPARRSAYVNLTCVLIYGCGLALTAIRSGAGWPGEPLLWLYLVNLLLTAADLKLAMARRTRPARGADVSGLRQRQHVRSVPGAADLAPLAEGADQ